MVAPIRKGLGAIHGQACGKTGKNGGKAAV